MKKVTAFMIFIFLPVCVFCADLTIIHTNDIHSHLLGGAPSIDYSPEKTGDDHTVGGMARIMTVINRVREDRENDVLLFDGGDFTMGSAFHLRCREDAFELELLQRFGYDGVALGNHEYDLRPSGLAQMLRSASSKDRLPPLFAANVGFNPDDPADDELEACFSEGLVKPYSVIDAAGLKIGIFGLMGKGAINDSPYAAPVVFSDPVETARSLVSKLESLGVDAVICLSHGGLDEPVAKSGDVLLAKEVPGIDVIISGHSHTRTEKPVTVGNTTIVQSGCYGEYVGILDLSYSGGEGFSVESYESRLVDDSIIGDEAVNGLIAHYRGELSRKTLGGIRLSWDSPVAETEFDLPLVSSESPVGNLLADAVAWNIRKAGAASAGEPLVVIESNGLIRASLNRGKTGLITAGDLFSVFPLGFGTEEELGYPMLLMYFTAEDLKKAMEVTTTVAPLMSDDYVLQISGLRAVYNPHRMLFDRVTSIEIAEDGDWRSVDMKDKDRLYKVSVNTYLGAMLSVVGDHTAGILNIVPRDADGRPVVNQLDFLIDSDPGRIGLQELKEWKALQSYVTSFPDNDGDGLPEIPAEYGRIQGRFVSSPSMNPVALMGGSWITAAAWGGLFFIVILIAGAVFLVIKIRRKRRVAAG